MKFNSIISYYTRIEDKPPITVDWSTTIQKLSTDLQGYDLKLELSTNEKMFNCFFNGNGKDAKRAILKAEKSLSFLEHYFYTYRTERFVCGASVLVGILAGQTTLDKAAHLVKGLSDNHELKAMRITTGKTRTLHDRTTLRYSFSIGQTRHSFSVEDVHKLAHRLGPL